jgi:N6-L-threonylcarbamoyladenine synthase
MFVLGIETSCDETSIAVYDSSKGIIASKISSQINIHSKFGGVVPEIASRNHLLKVKPLFDELLADCNITAKDLNLIGVTTSPGLIGALFVGLAFAKGLGYALKIPVLPINHLTGHILSAEIENQNLKPPYAGLIISGGHTHLYYVDCSYNFKLLSNTIDDAIGESFDKVAKMLGFGYPGGPFVEKEAYKGDENKISYPIPMLKSDNFSFSGLKTAVLNSIQKDIYEKEDIAASFQKIAVDSLILKVFRILKKKSIDKLVVAGGVACNSYLRKRFNMEAKNNCVDIYFPSPKLCTDNGDMIAYAAYKFLNKRSFLSLESTAYDTDPFINRY